MIKFVDFGMEHINAAEELAKSNYLEECEYVECLPKDVEIPGLEYFAENGLGVAAFEEEKLIGFIGVCNPFEGAFDSFDSLGVFSPIHAHGAVKENRGRLYQDMYEYAVKKWAKENILGMGIALYAHDETAKLGLFEHYFGMRCKDAITLLKDIPIIEDDSLVFEELDVKDFPLVRDMRISLNNHLREAPVFLQNTDDECNEWLKRVEAGDRRTFVAKKDGIIVSYLDVAEDGETFVTEHPKMKNIQGAYCSPEYRGYHITDKLLGHIAKTLIAEGDVYLGVDFESHNPTANRYWAKHFCEYTNSVVRKIENWSFGK